MGPAETKSETDDATTTITFSEHSRRFSILNRMLAKTDRQPKILPDLPRSRELVKPELADAINSCLRGESDWPLLVLGPPGVGKTFGILTALDAFHRSVYTSPSELHRKVLAADRGEVRNGAGFRVHAQSIFDEIADASLVGVDEIGLRSEVSDAHYENFKRLCDLRDHKATIYVSNVMPQKIAAIYDARILSRVASGTVVTLKGEDRRFKR